MTMWVLELIMMLLAIGALRCFTVLTGLGKEDGISIVGCCFLLLPSSMSVVIFTIAANVLVKIWHDD